MTLSLPPVLELGISAMVIGLSGAMAPGSYLTLTITKTVRSGRAAAFLMLVGHALLEAFLLIEFAFGLQEFLTKPVVMRVLSLAGGLYLLWMSVDLLRGVINGSIVTELETAEDTSRLGPVAQGALVSLANPYWLLWWVTIGAALAAKGLSMGPAGVASFFIGHQLADFAWYGFVIIAVSKGHHLLPPRVYRAVMGVLALFLLALGVRFGLIGAGVIPM